MVLLVLCTGQFFVMGLSIESDGLVTSLASGYWMSQFLPNIFCGDEDV